MSRRQLMLGLSALVLFLLFVFFSYFVHKKLFVQMDFNMTVRLQDHISRRFDAPFSYLSSIGSFEPMMVILLIILLIRRKVAGIVAFFLFGFMHLFEIYGKTFVDHHPPPEFMLRTEHIINFPQFHVSEIYSYPSGHSARALFVTLLLAGFVWLSQKLSLPWKVFVLGMLVCYDIVMLVSRIYLGEHWTTDVIGGSLLGASLAFLSLVFYAFEKKKNEKVLRPVSAAR